MIRPRTLLALVLIAPLCACSSTQWERFKAHGAASITSTLFGAAAILVGGPAGLALAAGGVGIGIIVDQALEPERETETVETTQIVQTRPPLPDGTPQEPRIDVFVTKGGGTRGNLKLPAPVNMPHLPTPTTWWDQMRRALQVAFWVIAAIAALAGALSNDRLRGWLFGKVVNGVAGATGAARNLVGRLRQALAKGPRPPH